MHSHGHGADVVRDARLFRGVPGVVERKVGRGDGDVGINVPVEEAAVLGHHAHLAAQRTEVKGAQVLAVVVDRALFRRLKAEQEAQKRRFAAARLADDGDVLA